MMRIDRISDRPDRLNRYRVDFSDGSVLRLYRQSIADLGLYTGLELDDEQMALLRMNAGSVSAKMRAVRIVSATNVSKAELTRRLVQKGEDPAQAEEAVAWMSELSLLDDRQTANQIVSRCIAKGYGVERAKQALYEKRVAKEYWDEALADYPDQTDCIKAFLISRLGKDRSPGQIKKAVDSLLRKGHHYSQIRCVLNEISVEAPEDGA